MGYLNLKNKKDFVTNFLGPVSNLNDMCVLHINDNKVICTVAAADSTIVSKAEIEVETDLENTKLNIPDIKKFIRVLDIIPDEKISLKINENSLSYNNNGYKFKYHLLDDGIIKQPNINVNKVILFLQ